MLNVELIQKYVANDCNQLATTSPKANSSHMEFHMSLRHVIVCVHTYMYVTYVHEGKCYVMSHSCPTNTYFSCHTAYKITTVVNLVFFYF